MRRIFLRTVLVAVALGLLLVVYGVAIEPRLVLDVRVTDARVPNLPPAWEGEEVVLLADLQVGLWLDNEGMVERVVDETVERRPAAVLIAGDFVTGGDGVDGQIDRVVEAVAPLPAAGIPTYGVLGNHDHGGDAAPRLATDLEAAGVVVLRNESVALPAPDGAEGSPLHLVGIGAHRPDDDRPERALRGLTRSDPRLVLMHNPASFEALPPHTAPVGLAGHTHGGQIRLPFFAEWSYLALVRGEPVKTDGWIARYGKRGNRLFVNRGVGMSLLPMRVNAPPELSVLVLRRADG